MLAICSLCATLSKEDLLKAISDKSHSVIQQLKHCFKFEIALHQTKNYVCNDCIRILHDCDGFFTKIQRAQETLQILFKAKSLCNAEKSAKKVAGTIRARDFCKIQAWQTENQSEPPTNSITGIPVVSKNSICPIEEYTCTNPTITDLSEIKVECDDPLETNDNNLEIHSNDQSIAFENFLRDVLNLESNTVEENSGSAEQSTSEESSFKGFDRIDEEEHYLEEPSEFETSDKDTTGKIKIGIIKYQCETCLKDFPNEQLLEKHLSSHNNGRAFKCKLCPKIFHNTSSLHYHTRTHLRSSCEEGAFKCGYCSKTYHRLDGLKIHLRTHSTENTFQCKKCLKKFRHASSLWYHMKAHTNDRQYQCQFCPKAYFRRLNLENHLARHQRSRLFTCEICEKNFNNQQKLKNHMTEHNKEKVFKCTKCPNTFTTSTGLNNHSRNHNRNHFTCGYCYKEFRSENWYKTHLRSHSVSARMQFKCANCTGTFLSQRSLNAHTCEVRTDE